MVMLLNWKRVEWDLFPQESSRFFYFFYFKAFNSCDSLWLQIIQNVYLYLAFQSSIVDDILWRI